MNTATLPETSSPLHAAWQGRDSAIQAKAFTNLPGSAMPTTTIRKGRKDELNHSLQSRQINARDGKTPGRPTKRPSLLNSSNVATMTGTKQTDVALGETRNDEFNKAVQNLKARIKQVEKIEGGSAQFEKQLQDAEAAKAPHVASSEKRVRSLTARSEAHKEELATPIQRPANGAVLAQTVVTEERMALQKLKDELQKLKEAAQIVTVVVREMTEETFELGGKKMDELRKLVK